jgi:hypothetical protein
MHQALKTQVDIFDARYERPSTAQTLTDQVAAPDREDLNCHQGSMLRKDCT